MRFERSRNRRGCRHHARLWRTILSCRSSRFLSLALAAATWASIPVQAADTTLAHGFTYRHEDLPEGPWSIHIVKARRSDPALQLQTALAGGTRLGMAPLSEQMKEVPPGFGRPLAALNGDFFKRNEPYLGDPKGLQIFRGELVSAPCGWSCFWVDPSGNPQSTNVFSRLQVIWPAGEKTPFGLNEPRGKSRAVLYTSVVGTSTQTSGGRELILERNGTNSWLPLKPGVLYSARVRQVRESGNSPVTSDTAVLSLGRTLAASAPVVKPGAVLQLSTATWPELNGVQTAIGGGPTIVRDGQVVDRSDPHVRHPRSAIGWNDEFYFLVEVDGRQRGLSVGMTIEEFAQYLVKIGCANALNLDGGGSSICWVLGQVMNSPSEGEDRGMGNAIVIVLKEKASDRNED